MRRNRSKHSGLTLIELVLAVTLMGFVILTAVNIEIVAHRFFSESDQEGQLQLKLAVAMEHIVKNLWLNHCVHGTECFIGGLTPPPAPPQIVAIEFAQDQPVGGVYTPENGADDIWLKYHRAGDRIMFCPDWDPAGSSCNVAEEVICDHITDFYFEGNNGVWSVFIEGEDGAYSVILTSHVWPRCRPAA